MEPILNKQEIADLLSAIRAGRVPLDLDDDKPQQNLKYTELNMFEAAHRRETNNKLTNFDIIIDNFSRNFGYAGHLGLPIPAKLKDILVQLHSRSEDK